MIALKLAQAKLYCKHGLQLVPLHSVLKGVCTCRKGKECGSPGKHPRLTSWPSKASSDIAKVESWLKKWTDCNLGVRLGPTSNIVDVEFDDEVGRAAAKRMLGDIETPTFVSDRSVHRLFRFPADLDLKTVKKTHGLEIRLGTEAKGAQSVLPPSIHHSGKIYAWSVSIDEIEIADFPDCLRSLIANGEKQNTNGSVLPDASDNGLEFTMQGEADGIARANAYVDCMPPAVQGSGGDKQTYRVACVAAVDFGLDKAGTMEVLRRFSLRCNPPWEVEDLQHKAEKAIEESLKRPTEVGKLRDLEKAKPAAKTKSKTRVTSRPPQPQACFKPFPADVLPRVLADLVIEGAKSIGCDPSFIAMPMLAVLASAIGNTHRLIAKQDWLVPPILWTAIIGESGTLKSPAFRLAVRPLREIQKTHFANHSIELADYKIAKTAFKKEIAALRKGESKAATLVEPQPPVVGRLLVNDITIEALAPVLLDNPRGVLAEVDELASWLGSFDKYSKGSGDSAKYLSMYSADSLIVDRKTGEPKTIYVPSASVSITGGIQLGILARLATREHFESGLIARFLLACPPRKIVKWNDAIIRQDVVDSYGAVLNELHQFGDPENICYVGMSESAKQLYKSFFNTHAEDQIEVGGDLAAAYSKIQEQPLRIALVLHCAQRLTGAVQADTMEAAIVLASWFKQETVRVYRRLTEGGTEQRLRELAEWIQNKHGGTVGAREVQQGRWKMDTSAEANAVLQELVNENHGEWILSEPGRRGQPTRRFCLHENLYIYGNTTNPNENTNTVDVEVKDEEKDDATGFERI